MVVSSDDDDFEKKMTPQKGTTGKRALTAKTALQKPGVKRVKCNTPAAAGNKLISEFFKPATKTTAPSVTPENNNSNVKTEVEGETLKEEKKNGTATNRGKRKAVENGIVFSRARRRLHPGTNLKLVSNRYHDEEQTRMSEFYEKTKEAAFGYFETVPESKLPVIIDGNLDVESCLDIKITEQSHILELNETQIDNQNPKDMLQEVAKMVHRIENPVLSDGELERERWNMEQNLVAVQQSSHENGNPSPSEEKENQKDPNESSSSNSKSKIKRKRTILCPPYKIISGTTFAVDAFRFGYIQGITHYFLTHYHSDHYIGLRKTFNQPIILSSVTAACVKAFINVDDRYLIKLDVGESMAINGITITAIDANQ